MSGAAGGANLIASNTSVIHGIGMRPVDIAVMGQAGAMLVWSPRSNIDLYGITADVTIYRNLGVPIALGTDWSASGSMNPLRELQCADSFNRDHLSEAFSDLELWSMATYWAALSQGAADQIGIIKEGHIADLAIFDGSVHADYRAILEAEPADVALVLRGGQPLHGDAALIEDLVGDTGCEALTMCGVEKRLCVELDTGLSLADIQGAVNSQAYPLFFCGTPDDEPSCDPARQGEFPERGGPDDADGDGVPDGTDNCPDVFNPIRPLDGATQGDADQDGLGNACDLCPLNPGETCRLPDPFDADGDDVPDTEDNCPGASNPDQSDVDGDDVGDACDSCPEISNPGNSPCPVSLYDVKDGTIAEGQAVLIEDVLVTASAPGYGFFVQIHPDDPGFAGAEYSGLFVYQGAASSSPQPGDRVDVSGNVQGFFGQVQLVTSSAPVVLSSDNAPPPPVTASAAALAAGGAQQEALEGVVVRVVDAEVSDIAPPPGAADSEPTGEFEIVGGLRVDDLFYAPNPFPSLGQTFPELLGVARWANGLGKLEPRGQQDYPAVLAAFDAELYFLLEGASAVPTPAMAVGLSHAAAANVTVDLVYGDPSVVSGPASVVVPAGTQSVPLTLTGLAAGSSTVTADDGDNVFVTSVRVYDDAEPRIPTLSPPEATVSLGAQTTLTVDIDLPAPGGGQLVALSAVPGTGITFPPSVTVPAGLLQTSFVVTGGNAATTEEVTATIGAASSQTTVNVVDSPAFADLIIVELYHDHTSGDDGFEWVKLYNGTGATLDLSDFSLGWGGTDYTYGTLALAGSVPNGACFLVGGPNGNADSGFPDVVVFDQTGDFDPDIQNSNGAGLADGVALFDVPAGSITAGTVPIDALIYGTDNASGLLDETGGVGVVDAPAAPATDSLQMLSDGTFAVSPSPAPLSCLPLPNP
jgi:hypothetical protein